MSNFDSLTEGRDIVLIDGSANCETDFLDYLYDINKGSFLDINYVGKVINMVDDMNSFFNNENVFTIPEVTCEISAFSSILGTKIKFLHRDLKFMSSDLKHMNPSIKKSIVRSKKNVDLLSTLQEHAYETIKLAKDNEYYVDSKSFQTLFNISKHLTRTERIKRDYGSQFHDFSNDTFADEKLVSLAFYLGIVKGVNTSILTSDYDLSRLYFRLSGLFYDFRFNNKSHGMVKNRLLNNKVMICNPRDISFSFMNYRNYFKTTSYTLKSMMRTFWNQVDIEQSKEIYFNYHNLGLEKVVNS